jgi:hypothetical protein
VVLYHGSSPENIAGIRKTGLATQSFLAASRSEVNKHVSAKRSNNEIMEIQVDPRDIDFSTGTNEYYAPEGLVPGMDGVWASPARVKAMSAKMEATTRMDLEAVNRRFNEELDSFNAGTLKPHEALHLGKPLEILQASGVKNGEMTVTQKTLKDHLKLHGLTVEDLKGLAKAIQDPIMVYEWGTKAKSTIIITELTTRDGRKITVALRAEHKGNNLSVNEIASVHGKAAERFLSEMENAKEGGLREALRYAQKEKALEWLGIAPPKGATQTEGLNSAAKVIQNFENPKISSEKSDTSETAKQNPESDETVRFHAEADVEAGMMEEWFNELENELADKGVRFQTGAKPEDKAETAPEVRPEDKAKQKKERVPRSTVEVYRPIVKLKPVVAMAKKMSRFREKWQDDAILLRRLEEELRKRGVIITEDDSVYGKRDLVAPRVYARAEKMKQQYYKPLIDTIAEIEKESKKKTENKKDRIRYSDIGRYLIALHAPERNAHIKKEHPKKDSGSGMSDEDAKKTVEDFESRVSKELVDKLKEQIAAIREFNLQNLYHYGRIDKDEYSELKTRYTYYCHVTLKKL